MAPMPHRRLLSFFLHSLSNVTAASTPLSHPDIILRSSRRLHCRHAKRPIPLNNHGSLLRIRLVLGGKNAQLRSPQLKDTLCNACGARREKNAGREDEEEETKVEWEQIAWVCDYGGRRLAPGPVRLLARRRVRLIPPDRAVSVLLVAGFSAQALLRPSSASGQTSTVDANSTSYSASCLHLHSSAFLPSPSTSTLFSAFESWLVSSSVSAGVLPAARSSIMGRATFTNGLFARRNNSRDRFLGLASVGIRPEKTGAMAVDRRTLMSSRCAGTISPSATRTSSCSAHQTCFEGSTYLFVFFRVPALQEGSALPSLPSPPSRSARCLAPSSTPPHSPLTRCPPGSQANRSAFRRRRRRWLALDGVCKAEQSRVRGGRLPSLHASNTNFHDGKPRFCAFCEDCVGIYYPKASLPPATPSRLLTAGALVLTFSRLMSGLVDGRRLPHRRNARRASESAVTGG
ncbi:hypothetical protein D9611_010553 [Ephemerocybe angulata]|uniref:Uncharacterized protein n=1 Tax=Ephemerocybe angulata TaxID=980116 RepID=A0A8H5FBE7_9AGAR|nr:hypothetical protein D9611_010553 [Tulosesus angulatus]